MKEFGKTMFAKTFYYLLHIISLAAFVGSAIIEILIGMMGFYEMTPEAIFGLYIGDFDRFVDDYIYAWKLIVTVSELRYSLFAVTAVSLVLTVIFLVLFLSSVGKKRGSREIHPIIFDKIPTDLYLAWVVIVYGCLTVAVFDFGHNVIRGFGYYIPKMFAFYVPTMDAVVCVAALVVGLLYLPIVLRGFAIRIKMGNFLTNTIIFRLLMLLWSPFKLMGKGFKNIHIIWRTVTVFAVLTVVELVILLGFFGESEAIIFFWVIEKIVLLPFVLFGALSLRKLEAAGEKLAAGDLKHKLDVKGLHWMFKKHGENLNSISDGMSRAVEKEIKSERMKTELITNVSHDIKTPLTSIINYATLISEEPCDNDKIKEYSEVLVRQSDRLKRLTEDLVEASKVSTGNIDVELVPCDPAVFVSQAGGEYEQKLEANNLTIITKLPEEEVKIMADGRRMWRVFDNLMNNICKYALPGTRVYLSLDIVGHEAVFTFKNTSREQLDITEAELMERFVRGDRSRNTEGNGLGLSIAKSMAEIQGGRLDISIDGDLFKATAAFPVI